METKEIEGVIAPTKDVAEPQKLGSSNPKQKNHLVSTVSRVVSSIIVGVGSGIWAPPIAEDVPSQIQDSSSVQENNAQFLSAQGLSLQEQKAEASQSLIRNETTTGQLHIDSEVLSVMDKNIKESGLEGIVGGIIIRDFNDPIFIPSEAYGTLISGQGLNKFSALVKIDKNQESNIYQLNIYLANMPTSKETGLHEIGHIPDWIPYLRQYPNQLPDQLKQRDFSDPEFEQNYHNRFVGYLQSIPSGELAPFTVPYEKQIVMGKSIELGDKLWSSFLSKISGPSLDESIKWAIPRNRLSEIANRMKDGIARDSLEEFIKGLDREEKAGQKRTSENYFSAESWGRFLMQSYYKNPDGLRKQLPDQFESIKQEALEAEERCRKEIWADMWALRVTNRAKAWTTYPEIVDAQNKVITFLTSQKQGKIAVGN